MGAAASHFLCRRIKYNMPVATVLVPLTIAPTGLLYFKFHAPLENGGIGGSLEKCSARALVLTEACMLGGKLQTEIGSSVRKFFFMRDPLLIVSRF